MSACSRDVIAAFLAAARQRSFTRAAAQPGLSQSACARFKVEVVIDYGLTDIAAGGLDAGIRSGGMVAKDMVAVRIGPDLRAAVVGSPAYFADRSKPRAPQDLTAHACINLRLPTHSGLYAWKSEKNGRDLRQADEPGRAIMDTAACGSLRCVPPGWRRPASDAEDHRRATR